MQIENYTLHYSLWPSTTAQQLFTIPILRDATEYGNHVQCSLGVNGSFLLSVLRVNVLSAQSGSVSREGSSTLHSPLYLIKALQA